MVNYADAFLAQRGIGAHDPPDGRGWLFAAGEVLVGVDDENDATDPLRRLQATPDIEEAEDLPEIDQRAIERDLALRLPRGFNLDPVGDPDAGPRRPPRRGQRRLDDRLRDELGFARWYLPGQANVREVAEQLRHVPRGIRADRPVDVRPNHVLSFEPYYQGGPGDVPVPTRQLDAPDGCDGSVDIAILDTGILDNWADDPWFSGRVDASARDHEVLDSDGDGVLDLQTGHGTFIAGVIARLAPCARLLARRVLDSFGLTDEVELALAIRDVADDLGAGVLNLSLGGYHEDDQSSPLLTRALRQLSSDAAVVAAAGNAASTRAFFPAAMKGVLAVGAIDDNGQPAPFTNRGGWVDCCAVGADVESRFVTFNGPRRGRPDPDKFEGYARWSGTSFATPVVAARIAQDAVDHSISPAEAARRLFTGDRSNYVPGLGVVVA